MRAATGQPPRRGEQRFYGRPRAGLRFRTTPKLKAPDVLDVLVLIRKLSERVEAFEDEDRAREFGVAFLRLARPEPVRMNEQGDRWRAFSILDDTDPISGARIDRTSVAARSVVLEDRDSGQRYVRASWFEAHVRAESAPGEARRIARQMLALGWQKPGSEGRIKASAPAREASLQWAFFVVPAGWERR